ncbi:DUF6445 family protein [Sphingomonas oryzagri]|uniref:DUF6445 family protein n=1 Tax=Sphingomonas oryzagri TaxID=3042314 RepID=A0ABT6MZB0_9SPHN|nr:DUF6445 family protein [Sphingomonas oryzagri]MDH7638394.1 DUF6445 family protein [Sphingomonas oryzagri]
MKPELHHVGEGRHPVVVVDGFTGRLPEIRAIAAAMAPFPASRGNYYPGLRRIIEVSDRPALAYVEHVLRQASPFIGGGFDAARFDVLEASFSMVTAQPSALSPAQRAPHFDSLDPGYLALLHYLSGTPGTAFYRQRATGIEIVGKDNVEAFVAAARPAAEAAQGYIRASDDHYEQIGMVEGVADRLVIYRGALLHSGIIAPDVEFSADPLIGRLTANLFVQIG